MATSVLITGASSGIGAETARRLAEGGFAVFGTSRRPQAGAVHPAVRWVAMDVCDEESVRKGVAQAAEASGGLDALVCNAGFGIFGSIEEVSSERARSQFETNVFGVLRTLRAVLPGMREAGRGRVVIVGSLAGRTPIPFQAHYSATKAAVDSLAQSLAMELAPSGVHVSLVEPGDIRTPFNDVTDWGERAASAYGERIDRCEQVIREALERAPGPEIVARTIERALRAERPRFRYPVGPESRIGPIGRRLLPDRWVHRLIRSHFRV